MEEAGKQKAPPQTLGEGKKKASSSQEMPGNNGSEGTIVWPWLWGLLYYGKMSLRNKLGSRTHSPKALYNLRSQLVMRCASAPYWKAKGGGGGDISSDVWLGLVLRAAAVPAEAQEKIYCIFCINQNESLFCRIKIHPVLTGASSYSCKSREYTVRRPDIKALKFLFLFKSREGRGKRRQEACDHFQKAHSTFHSELFRTVLQDAKVLKSISVSR